MLARSVKAALHKSRMSPDQPRRFANLGVRRIHLGLGFAFAMPFANIAYAAPEAPVGPLPGIAAVPGEAAPNAALAPAAASDRYSDLRWKGINVNLPPPNNTVDLGLFGIRDKLADNGIGYLAFSQNTAYSNVLHSAKSTNGRQVYNGQQPTALSTNFVLVTVDLSRYGIPDGQIAAVGFFDTTTWNPLGPNTANVGTLSYYQTAFNKRVELKIGLLANSFEFVGPYVAGSLSGGVFGPSGSLFFQGGMSGLTYPSYGLNVTAHLTEHVYDKIGIARALSPDGTIVEHNHNRIGLTWSTPNTGAYVINELGYLRPAGVDLPQTWVRGGGIYSGSHYNDLDRGGRSTGNYTLYLLADRQILQLSSDPKQAFRGIYAGFSAEFAPPTLNRFSEYYEARLYGLGLLPNRPRDQTSLLVTDTVFSGTAVDNARRARQLAHDNSIAITLSYSAQVIHGIYANAAVSYINNPSPVTYTSSTGSALNIIGGFSFFF